MGGKYDTAIYEGISKSFHTELIMKQQQQQQLQQKHLLRGNTKGYGSKTH
jgi:hypothetical protein